jgi:outer membrane receptor for ferrienterochelin and colicin
LEPFAKKAKLVQGDVAFPNFSDVQGKFAFVPSSTHQFTLSSIASEDGVYLVSGENKQTPDSVSIDNSTRNDVAGVEWLYLPTHNFTSKFSFSWYRNSGVSDFGGTVLDPGLDRERLQNSPDSTIRLYNVDISSSFTFQKYSLKEEMLLQYDTHLFEFGIARDWLQNDLYWRLQLSPEMRARFENLNIAVLNNFLQTQSYARDILYLQDKWKINELFTAQLGLRYNYFHLLKKKYVEPRLNIAYRFNPLSTIRAAWGLYYQSPGYEKLVDQNVFYSLTNAANLDAERAVHYIFGYERWLSSEIVGKVESYYKRFDNLIIQEKRKAERFTAETIAGQDSTLASGWTTPHLGTEDVYTNTPINNADGEAYGIELYLEKKQIASATKTWGYVSYALAWAQRNIYGTWRPLIYDQRHTINISANVKLNNWLELAVKWRYGTNFPYSPPSGIQPRIISIHIDSVMNGTHIDTTLGIIQTDRNGKVVFDIKRAQGNQINSRRLPPYHRLDIRATAFTTIWGLDWAFYLDIINVYNRTNILNYQFYVTQNLQFEKKPTSMFPILPTLGLNVKF